MTGWYPRRYARAERCILVDDTGRPLHWPEDSRRVFATYGTPDFDFPDYAVRNLGFVSISEQVDVLRVRLRPAFVGHRTAESLLSLLSQRPCARAGLSWFDSTWRHEVCAGSAPLERRLRDILHGAGDDAERPFLAVPRRIQAVLRAEQNPFAPVLRRWLDDVRPDGITEFLAAYRLYDRAMIVERRPDNGHFVFRHSGHGIRLYAADWSQSAIGRYLHEQPDRAYGRWIADACRAVDERQVPRYELITAHVAPHAGRTTQQWRYERLMLPWRDAAGRHLVVSVSLRDGARPD
jgi:hypothetical protein